MGLIIFDFDDTLTDNSERDLQSFQCVVRKVIGEELKIPVYFLGLGEQPDDLQPFSIDAYLDSLLPDLVESVDR